MVARASARRWGVAAIAAGWVALGSPPAALAGEPPPRPIPLFADVGARADVLADASAVTMGPTAGFMLRPTSKCVHPRLEVAAAFAEPRSLGAGGGITSVTGGVGALWGVGADQWFGAGLMFDLGWAELAAADGAGAVVRDAGFLGRAALVAGARWRLRRAFGVFLDGRVGHALSAPELGADGPSLGGPFVALSVGAVILKP